MKLQHFWLPIQENAFEPHSFPSMTDKELVMYSDVEKAKAVFGDGPVWKETPYGWERRRPGGSIEGVIRLTEER